MEELYTAKVTFENNANYPHYSLLENDKIISVKVLGAHRILIAEDDSFAKIIYDLKLDDEMLEGKEIEARYKSEREIDYPYKLNVLKKEKSILIKCFLSGYPLSPIKIFGKIKS